jgi:hypothetical protein
MGKVCVIFGIIFLLLSAASFIMSLHILWMGFAFWKLIASVIVTCIGVFWGLVLVIIGKKIG